MNEGIHYQQMQRNVTENQMPYNFVENSVWLKRMKLKDVNGHRKLSSSQSVYNTFDSFRTQGRNHGNPNQPFELIAPHIFPHLVYIIIYF
ncbi:hypothetical protein DYD21_15110 [Rhodohalobacter sp. SW132]|nr:hypothetical protein DYD21_15110 [Rhodohalobacter sp. SW132]